MGRERGGKGVREPRRIECGKGTGGGRGKGREAGVLRGWEAGEKCKTLIIVSY